MKKYSTLLPSSELEPHYQMLFRVIAKTLCVYARRESHRRSVRMRKSRDAYAASVLGVMVFFLLFGSRREEGKRRETVRKDFVVPL